MRYRYVLEFETREPLSAEQRDELRNHLDAQLESISDGAIAAAPVIEARSNITAFTGDFSA